MIINAPFSIGPRLLPALQIGTGPQSAWISLDTGNRGDPRFWIDLPDGSEHYIDDFSPGACSRDWRSWFEAILSFLGACAESRAYASRNGEPGENADLFSEPVGAWAESQSDEIEMLQCEIDDLLRAEREGQA